MKLPDYEHWRLVLASSRFNVPDRRDAYSLVQRALNAAEFPIQRAPTLLVMRTTDPLIRDVRRMFGKSKNVEGMRLGGETLGDRFIEYGYVYRIS